MPRNFKIELMDNHLQNNSGLVLMVVESY